MVIAIGWAPQWYSDTFDLRDLLTLGTIAEERQRRRK